MGECCSFPRIQQGCGEGDSRVCWFGFPSPGTCEDSTQLSFTSPEIGSAFQGSLPPSLSYPKHSRRHSRGPFSGANTPEPLSWQSPLAEEAPPTTDSQVKFCLLPPPRLSPLSPLYRPTTNTSGQAIKGPTAMPSPWHTLSPSPHAWLQLLSISLLWDPISSSPSSAPHS